MIAHKLLIIFSIHRPSGSTGFSQKKFDDNNACIAGPCSVEVESLYPGLPLRCICPLVLQSEPGESAC